jgi:cytochrome P450
VQGVTVGDGAIVPGPGGYPVIGHLLAFRKDKLGLLEACGAASGDVIELRIGRRTYLLRQPADVRYVYVTRHAVYAKGPRLISLRGKRISGDGVLTSVDEVHRDKRRRVQPVFRADSIAGVAHHIVREVDRTLDRWRDGIEIDLADEMSRLARATLLGCIFGVDAGREQLEVGVLARRRSLERARDSLVPIPAFVPIALRPRRRRVLRRLDRGLDRLIRSRSDQLTTGDDLLSMLLAVYEGGQSPTDYRRVYDEVLTLALTGYENVARVLTWTFLALARHREADEKLKAEVNRVIGRRTPGPDDWRNLRYTEMTVAESMRLWPPNPLFLRVARRDDVLPSGARIPAGSKLFLSPYVIQRDPEYFPDPLRFQPERFSEEGKRSRPRYAYFPFGGGPRVCIGQALAMLECTMALVRTAQRFRLDLIPGESAVPYTDAGLRSGRGPRMRVRSCT